ncbi:hypothetical protein F4604DRAFT_550935 [Suillus subluteus]|nr:hypothetical protein F4604DRAFT_550935 [Suillus subluteus]
MNGFMGRATISLWLPTPKAAIRRFSLAFQLTLAPTFLVLSRSRRDCNLQWTRPRFHPLHTSPRTLDALIGIRVACFSYSAS